MPGPTTERLDDDFRSLREDLQDLKVMIARGDERLIKLETLQTDIKSNSVDLAAINARVANLTGMITWLGSVFGLAAVYGILSVSSRLSVVETQLKNLDGQLTEVKAALTHRAPDTATELDERIRRIARAVVVETVKPTPPPNPAP